MCGLQGGRIVSEHGQNGTGRHRIDHDASAARFLRDLGEVKTHGTLRFVAVVQDDGPFDHVILQQLKPVVAQRHEHIRLLAESE